jgi:hypothetical protein
MQGVKGAENRCVAKALGNPARIERIDGIRRGVKMNMGHETVLMIGVGSAHDS